MALYPTGELDQPAPQPPPTPPNNTTVNTGGSGGMGGGFWGGLINNLTGGSRPQITTIATSEPLSDAQRQRNMMLMIFAFILIFFGASALIYVGFIRKA